MPAEMLIGRRLATGALRSAVDAAVGGAGGVVLLAGEAGMGKTALAAQGVAYAKARGAAAVWGTCWEGDGAPGFWPWIQVMRALVPDGGDAREGVLAELTGLTEERAGVLGDESAIRFRTYDLAATYLRRGAAQRPLVAVIDGTMVSTPTDPWRSLEVSGQTVRYAGVIANLTGNPAMSVPLWWNGDGLPIGAHFLGRFGEEATLIRLAAQLEAAQPWAGRRPAVHAARPRVP